MKGRIVRVETIALCGYTQPPIVDCAPLTDHAIALSAWSVSCRAVVTRKLSAVGTRKTPVHFQIAQPITHHAQPAVYARRPAPDGPETSVLSMMFKHAFSFIS